MINEWLLGENDVASVNFTDSESLSVMRFTDSDSYVYLPLICYEVYGLWISEWGFKYRRKYVVCDTIEIDTIVWWDDWRCAELPRDGYYREKEVLYARLLEQGNL